MFWGVPPLSNFPGVSMPMAWRKLNKEPAYFENLFLPTANDCPSLAVGVPPRPN